jgi:mutator protein MutT
MSDEILAAGGIVVDDRTGTPRVLLVHRPRYDDWSFPKGKLDAGETVKQAAFREVREETGIECKIVRKLATVRYSYRTRKGRRRPKLVHYFLMKPISGEIRVPGEEVDRAEWLDFEKALRMLSYDHDRKLLAAL